MTYVGIAIISYILGSVSAAAGIFAAKSFGDHMAELDAAIARHDAAARAAQAANDGEVRP